MPKKYKRLLRSCLPIILFSLLGALFWHQLPNQIATHFSSEWVPNGWSSKPFTVIGLPLIFLIIQLIVVFFIENDPQNTRNQTIVRYSYWLVPIIGSVCMLAIYGYALGVNLASLRYFPEIFVALIFLAIGFILPYTKQNTTIGIKVPWTLHSEKNWNMTHHFAGKVFLVCGACVFFLAFFAAKLIYLPIIAAIALPIAYSYFLYRKGI